jgi:hypothetical protein
VLRFTTGKYRRRATEEGGGGGTRVPLGRGAAGPSGAAVPGGARCRWAGRGSAVGPGEPAVLLGRAGPGGACSGAYAHYRYETPDLEPRPED